ncbi:MAG: hypothetical protein V1793_23845 [Pseudomonadota bacterium]
MLRSYYEVLRDELDQFILGYALVDSYNNFSLRKLPYPFVEIRELKPRARIPITEFEHQNSFLVIFTENSVDQTHKKYIRYFDANRTTKTNLLKHIQIPEMEDYNRNLKYVDAKGFFDLMKTLFPVDYALLIQRDEALLSDRYALTHFHVRVDWPIADAAEELAKDLRYISKELYEKGDKYADTIQKKFFEYYGMPVMVGGRRTAAIVAAQYFRKLEGITTVYVGSSESRALLRIDEKGLSKSVLVKFSREDVREILKTVPMMTQNSFTKNYAVSREGNFLVCIFNIQYAFTPHSLPSEGGRLREINPDPNWLTISEEQILPKPNVWKHPPIPFKIVYS